MKTVNAFVALSFAAIFTRCDKTTQIVTPDSGPSTIKADSIQELTVNDFHVTITNRGELLFGRWKRDSGDVSIMYGAGLWICMEQNGTFLANLVQEAVSPYSNYTARWNDESVGVYRATPQSIIGVSNWPAAFGAPFTNTGSALVYGDEMCWSALGSDTTILDKPLLAQPIRGIRVTQASYAYSRSDLRNVLFLRYEIANLSIQNWTNIYVGFFSDTDIDAPDDRTGFDSTRMATFTYVDSAYSNNESFVAGFTFLETPKNVGTFSHRILRKNNYINPDFGEYGLTSPQVAYDALKGLSNSGQPMINPVTGLTTRFAFTGDPVTGTGWIDTRVDVRSLLSSGPFDLNAGEKVTVTLVWVINDGADLAQALNTFKSKIDQVRGESNLWQFQ